MLRGFKVGDGVRVHPGSRQMANLGIKPDEIGEIVEAGGLPGQGFRVKVKFPDRDILPWQSAGDFVLVDERD